MTAKCTAAVAQSQSFQRASAAPERRHADVEDVGEAVRVVPGDAVAVLRRAHGFEQRDGRRRAHVVLRRIAEPGGRGEHDRLEHVRGVRRRRALSSTRPTAGRRSSAPSRSAASAIGADISTMPRLVLQSTALRVAAIAPRTRSPTRAPGRAIQSFVTSALNLEIADGHAVPVGKIVHVAGLRRPQLVEAGATIGFGDLIRRKAQSRDPAVPSLDRSARQKRSARCSAMSIFATLCRPDQAGMEFTSST